MTAYAQYKHDVGELVSKQSMIQQEINALDEAFMKLRENCPHTKVVQRRGFLSGYLQCIECGFPDERGGM